jgi:hypothetical protein
MECHHLKSAGKGGGDDHDNLIALCPLCHSVVEKLRGSLCDNPNFQDWIMERYGEDGYNKFGTNILDTPKR